MGVCARGLRWFDARNRLLHVVVSGVQSRNSVSRVHRRSSWAIREMAEWEHTQNTRQRARQGLPEPFALARIRVQRCRPRRFDQTFTGSSPHNPREKRLQPLSRAPIACARRVGATCIVTDLQKTPTIVKIVRFSKTLISVPKIQACSRSWSDSPEFHP
jgi:hypothetical protein